MWQGEEHAEQRKDSIQDDRLRSELQKIEIKMSGQKRHGWMCICEDRKRKWSKGIKRRGVGGVNLEEETVTTLRGLASWWRLLWQQRDGRKKQRGVMMSQEQNRMTKWGGQTWKCGLLCSLHVSESSSELWLINTQHKAPINQSIPGRLPVSDSTRLVTNFNFHWCDVGKEK